MRNRSSFVFRSVIATQLSALTGRPVINREVPKIVSKGRPVKVEVPGAFGVARRASLLRAVDRFNARGN